MRRKLLWALTGVLFSGALFVAGCSPAFATGNIVESAAPISITLVPGKASLTTGASLTLNDYVFNSRNKSVNWMVNGVAGGNAQIGMIVNGVYQAPVAVPQPNTVTITAQSQANLAVFSNGSVVTLSNPTPVIASISPNPISYGPFRLTVTGSGFVSGAQVTYGTTALPTTFVSSTELTATGTAAPVIGAIVPITVTNPGATPIVSAVFAAPLQQRRAQVSYASAFHFLEQATFGPSATDIANLQKSGFSAWFAQQTAAPISQYEQDAVNNMTLQSDFFANALTGPDQLRQRVGFALSEIFVVSGVKNYSPDEMLPYLQILQNDALGNFYDLMNDITLSASMGKYLDMANNVKGQNGTLPNENYGRELMQLFTIGPVLLNSDGTPQMSNGQTIPAYTETTIQNFARVFTGWTYPPMPGVAEQPFDPPYFAGPMVAWESNHDTGSKTLLNGTVLPAGQTAEQDLTEALQNVFNHPNVGPWIATQLIQHLVSSNPSPAYVQRIAAVFDDDGTGVRGNLSAVVQALLLDKEARQSDNPSTWIPTGGKLREPVLFIASVLRALNATTTGSNVLAGLSSSMGQDLFYPPSVAGYFPPSYPLPGNSSLLGPEFYTLNCSSGLGRVNWINSVSWGQTGSSGIGLDLSPFTPLAGNSTGLLQAFNNAFMAGQMSTDMQTAVAGALASISLYYPTNSVASALYLTASSGLYQIQH